MGRNFVGHFAKREWNVIPVTSVIEVQYAMAPGTALVQKRHGGDGVTHRHSAATPARPRATSPRA